MKANFIKTTAVILLLAASAHSCFDEEPDCKTGRCIKVRFKGTVRVLPSGEGLKNVPVKVTISKDGQMGRPHKNVGSGKTNKNGEFDFNGIIDLSFGGTLLKASIPSQDKYFNVSNEIYFTRLDFNNTNMLNALKRINFVFYNKASLTINLNRTLTDEFDWISIGYFPAFREYPYPRGLYRGSEPKPTATFQVETAADIYTKIQWQKFIHFNNEPISVFVDSLICKQNVNNVININY